MSLPIREPEAPAEDVWPVHIEQAVARPCKASSLRLTVSTGTGAIQLLDCLSYMEELLVGRRVQGAFWRQAVARAP